MQGRPGRPMSKPPRRTGIDDQVGIPVVTVLIRMDTAPRDRPTGVRAAATPDAGDADATPTVDITDLDDEP